MAARHEKGSMAAAKNISIAASAARHAKRGGMAAAGKIISVWRNGESGENEMA